MKPTFALQSPAKRNAVAAARASFVQTEADEQQIRQVGEQRMGFPTALRASEGRRWIPPRHNWPPLKLMHASPGVERDLLDPGGRTRSGTVLENTRFFFQGRSSPPARR